MEVGFWSFSAYVRHRIFQGMPRNWFIFRSLFLCKIKHLADLHIIPFRWVSYCNVAMCYAIVKCLTCTSETVELPTYHLLRTAVYVLQQKQFQTINSDVHNFWSSHNLLFPSGNWLSPNSVMLCWCCKLCGHALLFLITTEASVMLCSVIHLPNLFGPLVMISLLLVHKWGKPKDVFGYTYCIITTFNVLEVLILLNYQLHVEYICHIIYDTMWNDVNARRRCHFDFRQFNWFEVRKIVITIFGIASRQKTVFGIYLVNFIGENQLYQQQLKQWSMLLSSWWQSGLEFD